MIIRIVGMLTCFILMIVIAVLSMNAGEHLYLLYLLIASLLGVGAGLFKNMGKQ